MTQRSPLLLALGVILLAAAAVVSLLYLFSGAQPWGQLLGDNFMFARTIPFSFGLGIVLGFWKAASDRWGTEQRADGAIRRFAPSTVWLHALAGLAVVGLIATGGWQYLKGLLDAETPVYMGTVYRVHYIAASLLIITTLAFVTAWLTRGERGLTPGKGQMIRGLRGLAHELPRPIGSVLAYLLGLNLRRAAPPTGQFSFYQRLIGFPWWELAIGLVILTGAIKAFRYIVPIPGDVLYWMSAVPLMAIMAHRSNYSIFEDDRRNGMGTYLTEEQITRRNASYTSELVRGMRGMRVVGDGMSAKLVSLRRKRSTSGASCSVNVVINGQQHMDINMIEPGDIGGIEVYPSANGVPLDYVSDSSCGAVVIWTKK